MTPMLPTILAPSTAGWRLSPADWAVIEDHPEFAQLVALVGAVVRAREAHQRAAETSHALYEASRETYLRARKAGGEAVRRLDSGPGGTQTLFEAREDARNAWNLAQDRAVIELLRSPRDPAALDAAQAAEIAVNEAYEEAEAVYEAAYAAKDAAKAAAFEEVDAAEGGPIRRYHEAEAAVYVARKTLKRAEKALNVFWKTARIPRFFKPL